MVQLREIGKTGVKVPAIGLGCMETSAIYGTSDSTESLKVLNRAIEIGCTFWDTSASINTCIYTILLSQFLKEHRDKIFICTKFGYIRKPDQSYEVSGKREYVRQACESSLKRLGVDYIDLYYQHRVDPNTPIEETVKAMAELVKEGKVKYLGISECSAETLRRAYKVHPISAIQVEYGPWLINIENNGIMEACRELGVTIVAFGTLGRGFLSGTIKSFDDLEPNDLRRKIPRFQGENFKKNLELVYKLQELSTKKGLTPSQLCLAWTLAQRDNIIIIPGTKRIKYLEENFNTQNIRLTNEDLDEIRQVINSIEMVGTIHPEWAMKVRNIFY
ncbi:aldo/keto reductase [Rhizophagus irregularis]|uniref:Aldo/keto reductase n=1 Tax=Rhizophagus irregularis TaxID=588596 RepID=A0A2I1G8A3_9GLOM|nr:aldo/keto reductase [Rhizophagus irregularis]